jgi:hypothetical protein
MFGYDVVALPFLSSEPRQFVLTSESNVNVVSPNIVTMTVCLWNHKQGDPSAGATGDAPFKGKFPAGTFVFPFEFPALPADICVRHPDDVQMNKVWGFRSWTWPQHSAHVVY